MKLIAALQREPLAGFMLAGTLIFGLYALAPVEPMEEPPIVVTSRAVQAMVAERELVLGRPLRPQEHDALVARFIDEEVLVREAYAQGLDRVDGKVRGQLIRKMTFLLEEEPEAPSQGQLEDLYAADPERYRLPARLDLRQVLLEEDADATGLLRALRERRLTAEAAGEVQTLGQMTARELTAVLETGEVEDLFDQPPGTWSGPYALPPGRVLLQVTGSHPAREMSPQLRQRYLHEDWMKARRAEMLASRLAELRRKYRVEMPPDTALLQLAER